MTNVIKFNKEVQVIEQREVLGKDFKMYGTVEEPLFLAKDVAEWIEHSNTSKMVKDAELEEWETVKHKLPTLTDSYSRNNLMTDKLFLTEDGLYEVLMQSRKPIAKSFKKKVKEILKDVRKHGMYATDDVINTMLDDPDTMITLLTNYKEEKTRRLIAEQQVQELQPKATYYDLILDSSDTMTATQIAKDYGMSAQEFNTLLSKLGIQYKQSGQWLLYKEYQSNGYTHSKSYKFVKYDGTTGVNLQTKWTQKGRLFLYEILKDNEVLPSIEHIA
ncbi:phage antirepressor [Staphylococcus kloosii]|uniref:phage antirepressor n=1 Tax=Staphylococcus kloosii TaxID=29384 RepID=UPI00189D46B9|nr:phage antirepressor KilAC domain-containing protein [Staphylococcus kloosii]MBF7025946.1 phage antirepressor KilAC domain-containing protein [Staphylococcus kloosii]